MRLSRCIRRARAQRLAELADAAGIDRSSVRIAAISEAAASGGWARAGATVMAAAEPNDGALLELAARLCEKP